MLRHDRAHGGFDADPGPPVCHFGILEGIGAALATVGTAVGGAAAGVGSAAAGLGIAGTATTGLAGAIGTGVVDAGIGAGLGAAEGAITHGNVGVDALGGAFTGGAIGGLGGAIGSATGLGTTAGDTLAGAAGGALGAGVTHGNPLTGALEGGAAGLAAGALGGTTSSAPGVSSVTNGPSGSGGSGALTALGATSGAAATPGPSAASISAPASVAVGTDLASTAAGGGGSLTASALGIDPSSPLPLGTIGNVPNLTQAASPSGSLTGAPAAATQLGVTAPASTGNGPLSEIGNFLSGPNGKLLGTAVSGAGLLKDLMSNNDVAGLSNISGLAKQASQQGSLLQSYLTNGTLPPAIQASVNAATKDGITALKAKYASQGVAPGSSAEINDIARLQQNSIIQGATLADQLLQQGVSESTLSGSLYKEIVAANQTQNAQTGSAITALASALAGGGTKPATGQPSATITL